MIFVKLFTKHFFIGEIVLTGGVGLFIYNVFNFSSSGGTGGEWTDGGTNPFSGIFGSIGGRYEFEYVVYYYRHETLLMIAIGAMLVTLGILIIKNQRK